MQENRADVIFHPVRIRVVQALLGDRKLTAQQLESILNGPSIATLYRHLNRMVEAGIIAVVEERPIRGAAEKVYALAHDRAADFTPAHRKQISQEDRMRHFATLVGSLLSDFGRYLDQKPEEKNEAGLVVRQEALYLSDQDAGQVGKLLKEAIAPYLKSPDASLPRHMLTMILLPVVGVESTPGEPD